MTKEDIAECLNNSKERVNNRKLLAFCNVPRTFAEMGKGSGVKGGGLFKSLVELKVSGCLAFADGKYFATPEALEELNSSQ